MRGGEGNRERQKGKQDRESVCERKSTRNARDREPMQQLASYARIRFSVGHATQRARDVAQYTRRSNTIRTTKDKLTRPKTSSSKNKV